MQHLRIGITGGMGAGKSTVCEIFSKIGISVYDADSRAKWLMSEDQDLKQQIKSNFGWDSYTRNEDLNRDYLAKVVFNNEDKLKVLNSLVHPVVMKDFEMWSLEHKNEPYSIKEAALLFESNSYKNLHKIIVINSPIETRIERVIKRDHVKREDVLKRIQNQSTDRQRMEKADWIIYNDGQNSLIEQTIKIHQEILDIRVRGTIPFKV